MQAAQAASTEKLRRYEIKCGPSSPRLNPLETLLNYGLSRVPGLGFGPTAGGPGPLELVTSYSNSELTANGSWKDLRVMSAAHVGLRLYTFDSAASGNPLTQLRHPGWLAVGGSAFSAADRPLDNPLQAGRRYGAFVDWGRL